MPFVEKPPANALRSNHATFEIDILLSLFSYFVLPSIHDSFSFLFFSFSETRDDEKVH